MEEGPNPKYCPSLPVAMIEILPAEVYLLRAGTVSYSCLCFSVLAAQSLLPGNQYENEWMNER